MREREDHWEDWVLLHQLQGLNFDPAMLRRAIGLTIVNDNTWDTQ